MCFYIYWSIALFTYSGAESVRMCRQSGDILYLTLCAHSSQRAEIIALTISTIISPSVTHTNHTLAQIYATVHDTYTHYYCPCLTQSKSFYCMLDRLSDTRHPVFTLLSLAIYSYLIIWGGTGLRSTLICNYAVCN